MKTSLNFDEWFQKAVRVLFNDIDENELDWSSVFSRQTSEKVEQLGLFTFDYKRLNSPSPDFLESFKKKSFEDFKKLIDPILCHETDDKFRIAYGILKKFKVNPAVLQNPSDDLIRKAQILKKQVGRDIHKMRAFVRFNEAVKDGEEYYIAYHKPDHFILKKNANFFKDRFGNMKWAIFTPYAVLAWNKEKLFYKEGSFSPRKFANDPFVNLWKTYFVNIFNPARLKIKAMKNEMPVRYWENMPEADLIPEMIRTASSRVMRMKKIEEVKRPPADSYFEKCKTIEKLNENLKACQSCDLCNLDNNVVGGEGSSNPRVLIVGEAPGDLEDMQGRPFIGPAGKLLKDCLAELGLNIEDAYLTNSVKHFNFERKGNRRIHKSPKTKHLMACRPWLSKEVDLLEPDRILCLGRTAVHTVFGFPTQIETMRGREHKSSYPGKTFVTYHPARILRENNSDTKAMLLKKFKSDIQAAFSSSIRS